MGAAVGTAQRDQFARVDPVAVAEALIAVEEAEVRRGGTIPNPLAACQQLVNRSFPEREIFTGILVAAMSPGEGSILCPWCILMSCENSGSTVASADAI